MKLAVAHKAHVLNFVVRLLLLHGQRAMRQTKKVHTVCGARIFSHLLNSLSQTIHEKIERCFGVLKKAQHKLDLNCYSIPKVDVSSTANNSFSNKTSGDG